MSGYEVRAVLDDGAYTQWQTPAQFGQRQIPEVAMLLNTPDTKMVSIYRDGGQLQFRLTVDEVVL